MFTCNITDVNKTYYFEFSLDFPKFSPRQDLYVRRNLLSRSGLTGPQFDITGDQLVATCKTNAEKM